MYGTRVIYARNLFFLWTFLVRVIHKNTLNCFAFALFLFLFLFFAFNLVADAPITFRFSKSNAEKRTSPSGSSKASAVSNPKTKCTATPRGATPSALISITTVGRVISKCVQLPAAQNAHLYLFFFLLITLKSSL